MNKLDQQTEQSQAIAAIPAQAWHQRKWVRRGIYAALIALAIWFYYFKPPAWYEEVQLSDGSFIVIKQRMDDIQTFSSGIGDGGGWYANKYQIDANEKLGIKTPWVGLYGMPLLLDKNKQGQWVVISTFSMCKKFAEFTLWKIGSDWQSKLTPQEKDDVETKKRYGWKGEGLYSSLRAFAPKQFYLEYRYINDQWVIQSEVEPQYEGRKSNLLLGVYSHFDRPYFSAKGKQERYERMSIHESAHNILFNQNFCK